jgi:hypothetical protein
MGTIKQSDFDKLVAHTIRIELKNGLTVIYWVSVESKTAFYKLLKADAISDNENEFLWFYIPEDRLVLVNKKEIIRITFCFDPPNGEEPQYRDNFNLLNTHEESIDVDKKPEGDDIEGLYLPQLIVVHNRQKEKTEIVDGVTMETEGYFGNISSYSNLDEGDVQGLNFEYFHDEGEWALLTYKYLQFIDNDGEENFMPLENLSVIEVERPLLMSDTVLDLYLDRKPKRKTKTKK